MPVDVYASTELDLPNSSPKPTRLLRAQGAARASTVGRRVLANRVLANSVLVNRVLANRMLVGCQQVADDWKRGFTRFLRLLPAEARLMRWRITRKLQMVSCERQLGPGSQYGRSSWRRTRELRRWPPVLLLLGLTAACGLVSHQGKDGKKDEPGRKLPAITPLPDLSKEKRDENASRPETPWFYVLPVDHGVREDKSGKGHFRAPRFHGEHNGIDLLAPVGTPVFSPCDGEAMSGASQSFGRWLHVICPVPDAYRGKAGPQPWASFFYAHLSTVALPHNEWVEVERAEEIGQVGKSGNARGPNVQPHLHLELIVQRNHRKAMDEHHLGKDQSDVKAAGIFAERLSDNCLAPFGFQPKSRQLRRARRLDPFVSLTCLSPEKPDFVKAPKPLSAASNAWSKFYIAKNFDVNHGPDAGR